MSKPELSVDPTTLDKHVERLVIRGHFLGKEGGHINGRLSKQRLFGDPMLFEQLVSPLKILVKEFNSTLLIAEERSAATLARWLGTKMLIDVVTVKKDVESLDLSRSNTDRALLIEDNIVSGKSLERVIGLMAETDINPVGLVSLFDSNGESVNRLSQPINYLYNLNISSWNANDCELCEEFGEQSLGLSREQIALL